MKYTVLHHKHTAFQHIILQTCSFLKMYKKLAKKYCFILARKNERKTLFWHQLPNFPYDFYKK